MVSARFALHGHLEKPKAMILCGLLWSPSDYFEPQQWTEHDIPDRLPSPLPTPLSKPQPTLLPILFANRILRIQYQKNYGRIRGRSRLTLERKFAAVAVELRLVAQSNIDLMVLSSSLKDCCQKSADTAAISKQLISHTHVTLTSPNDLRPPSAL